MKEKIQTIFGFIKRNWFKLALLVILIWFGFIFKRAAYNLSDVVKMPIEIINYEGKQDYCNSYPLSFWCLGF